MSLLENEHIESIKGCGHEVIFFFWSKAAICGFAWLNSYVRERSLSTQKFTLVSSLNKLDLQAHLAFNLSDPHMVPADRISRAWSYIGCLPCPLCSATCSHTAKHGSAQGRTH